MTASRNDITQDRLISKTATDLYREGYDLIFNKAVKTTPDLTIEPSTDFLEVLKQHVKSSQ